MKDKAIGVGLSATAGRSMLGADVHASSLAPEPAVVPPLSECPSCHCWHGGTGKCYRCNEQTKASEG
jgi:hypothetical protein